MIPPANAVAAPIEIAVATAGAMCVIDWNRTSVRPIALGASPPDEPVGAWSTLVGVAVTVNPPPLAPRVTRCVPGLPGRSYQAAA